MKLPEGVPRWYRYAPFLGSPPELSPRQWRVLGLVAVVSLFEQYDMYLFSLNLSHIQADLSIAEGDLGWLGSLVRAGSLISLPIALAADRVGRRRILLATVVAYTLLTGATALVPDARSFVLFQTLARGFASAETLLAAVVIAEEFSPAHRGWGIGALGAIQACGAGLAAVAFGFVDWLPFGWRSLYLLGLGPLIAVAWWRRSLPETERFVAMQRQRVEMPGGLAALEPLRELVRAHPGRLTALCAALFMLTLFGGPATFFAPKYLQDVHGWSPGSVALLNLIGGFFAIIGNPVAGRLGDHYGRRPVTTLFSVGFACVTLAFYGLLGFMAPLLWVALIFSMMGVEVSFAAYGTELFPTSQRSTASGLRTAVATGGGVAGLALISLLFALVHSNWIALMLLAAGGFVSALIVFFVFPETAGRSLEEIAPERN